MAALNGYGAKYTFARSDAFTNKVQVACVKQALIILTTEAATPPANHKFRHDLAKRVLDDPTVLATDMALAIVMYDLGVGDDVTDDAILGFVATLWDTFTAQPPGWH